MAASASVPGAALRAAIGFRSGGPASSGMDVRHRGIGFGSCCYFESFERLPIRRFGIHWNGHPSSQNRLRLLLAALRASSSFRSGGSAPAAVGCFESFERLPIWISQRVVGARTDVGTCCGFAAGDVRHRGIGFAARVRDDGALLWLLLLLLISPAGKFLGHYSRRTTPPREDLRSVCERLQNSEVNARK